MFPTSPPPAEPPSAHVPFRLPPRLPHIAPAFLEEILFALFQTFMAGANGDIAAARAAALAALAAYDPHDEQELRLAAQIIQYSFGALDSLARAIDPGLPLNTLLRLRGSANAMQRSANQCQRTLERLRKERRQAQPQQAATAAAAAVPVMAGPDPGPGHLRTGGATTAAHPRHPARHSATPIARRPIARR
ncbi:MAG TPA: hypothetical protein VE690_03415, partial [Rhodopila sp.]|nr:hypothetical protein [Rhodopila sp.]